MKLIFVKNFLAETEIQDKLKHAGSSTILINIAQSEATVDPEIIPKTLGAKWEIDPG